MIHSLKLDEFAPAEGFCLKFLRSMLQGQVCHALCVQMLDRQDQQLVDGRQNFGMTNSL